MQPVVFTGMCAYVHCVYTKTRAKSAHVQKQKHMHRERSTHKLKNRGGKKKGFSDFKFLFSLSFVADSRENGVKN